MEVTEQIEQLTKKKRGGARPNSGPKRGVKYKKTIEREILAKRLAERIGKKIDPLADALIETALTGDVSALRESFERSIGKVRDVHDVNVREMKPILGGITNVQGNYSTEETTDTP